MKAGTSTTLPTPLARKKTPSTSMDSSESAEFRGFSSSPGAWDRMGEA